MRQFAFKLLLALLALAAMGLGAELAMRAKSRLPSHRNDRSPWQYGMDAARAAEAKAGEDNPLRIAVIGDSFTEGAGVEVIDRYGSRLEYLLNLNEGARPADVKVFAISGTSTFQQKRLLTQAIDWGANLVLLGICLNDMEDWTKGTEVRQHINDMVPHPPPKSESWAIQHSLVLSWIYTKVQIMHARRAFLEYYDWLYSDSYSGRALFDGAIDWFAEVCAKHDVQLVAVIFPLLSHELLKERYPFMRMHEIIHEVMDRHHVRYIDLYEAFSNMAHERLEVIPGIDPHPDEIAHRIAAESIMYHLLEEEIIPQEYKPHHLMAQPKARRWNQLDQRIHDPAHLAPESHDLY